jgi:ATP-binding cassette subfamily B protein
MELLPNLGLVVVLGFGGHQVLRGDLTIAELVAFNIYLALLVWPLRSTGLIVSLAQRAAASADRVHEVLATAPAIADPPHARGLPPGGGELRFEGVHFGYLDGSPVLEGLDLVVPAGQSVAVVGATGSGKSTVARLVPRFYDVDAGTVRIDGVDVRQLRLNDLRKAVGIVFEETFLFSSTIRSNIAFADPDASDEAVERPPGCPAPTTSSGPCPRATRPSSASGASRSRAGSASASPSPGGAGRPRGLP